MYVYDLTMYFIGGIVLAGVVFLITSDNDDVTNSKISDMLLVICGFFLALITLRFLMLTGVV